VSYKQILTAYPELPAEQPSYIPSVGFELVTGVIGQLPVAQQCVAQLVQQHHPPAVPGDALGIILDRAFGGIPPKLIGRHKPKLGKISYHIHATLLIII
jgi:hypothetical protein